jgi:hypothetical protein
MQVAMGDGTTLNGALPKRAPADQKPGGGQGGGAPERAATNLPRKIVYNAEVRLVVKDLAEAVRELKQLVKEHDAFFATADTSVLTGAPPQGSWRIRVPVERFDSFLDGVVKLGIPQKNKTDSQDVSEEYYDLLGRIKNKQAQEERLRGYLQDKKLTSKMDEIALIEKEMARVREELDSLEGRYRRLQDLTALSTVTLTMQEIKDYVPPQAPTFVNRIGSTFFDSLDWLGAFGRGLTLLLVALAPWLVVLAVVLVPVWLVWRRSRPRLLFAGRGVSPVADPPVLEEVAPPPATAEPARPPDKPPGA